MLLCGVRLGLQGLAKSMGAIVYTLKYKVIEVQEKPECDSRRLWKGKRKRKWMSVDCQGIQFKLSASYSFLVGFGV